jgi:hypothetical protein
LLSATAAVGAVVAKAVLDAVAAAALYTVDVDDLASSTAARTPSVTQQRHKHSATRCSVAIVTAASADSLVRGLKASCSTLVAIVGPICKNNDCRSHTTS